MVDLKSQYSCISSSRKEGGSKVKAFTRIINFCSLSLLIWGVCSQRPVKISDSAVPERSPTERQRAEPATEYVTVLILSLYVISSPPSPLLDWEVFLASLLAFRAYRSQLNTSNKLTLLWVDYPKICVNHTNVFQQIRERWYFAKKQLTILLQNHKD